MREVSASDIFDSYIYKRKHPGTLDFLREQTGQLTSRMTDSARGFYDTVRRDVYERYDESHAQRIARAAARHVSAIWRPEGVTILDSIGKLQHANDMMQRYVMAEPQMRRRFHRQQCDGYSESYVDDSPGRIGETHYDYRRATHGMFMAEQVVDDGDNFTEELSATSYYDDIRDERDKLSVIQQCDILQTWEHLRAQANAKREDPTSRWNQRL